MDYLTNPARRERLCQHSYQLPHLVSWDGFFCFVSLLRVPSLGLGRKPPLPFCSFREAIPHSFDSLFGITG